MQKFVDLGVLIVFIFYFYLFLGIALIAIELMSTTFYLLIIAIACIIANLTSFIVSGWAEPTISAGALSIAGCYLLSKRRGKKSIGSMMVTHIGQIVEVVEINGTQIRVLYCGTYWNAVLKRNIPVKVGDRLAISRFSNYELELEEVKVK